jgi:hypothetical protein
MPDPPKDPKTDPYLFPVEKPADKAPYIIAVVAFFVFFILLVVLCRLVIGPWRKERKNNRVIGQYSAWLEQNPQGGEGPRLEVWEHGGKLDLVRVHSVARSDGLSEEGVEVRGQGFGNSREELLVLASPPSFLPPTTWKRVGDCISKD